MSGRGWCRMPHAAMGTGGAPGWATARMPDAGCDSAMGAATGAGPGTKPGAIRSEGMFDGTTVGGAA